VAAGVRSLAQIDVGGQVWGVNAGGDVYRHEPTGQWKVIGSGFKNVSAGTTYN